jgi:hypothetical protein
MSANHLDCLNVHPNSKKQLDKNNQTKTIRQKQSDKNNQTKTIRQKQSDKNNQTKTIRQKQSTAGIRWWSPTQLLTGRHMA